MTFRAYIAAIEQRLSMRDVLPRGYDAKVNLDSFLRSDTLGRMQAYKLGLEVNAYTSDEDPGAGRPPANPEVPTGRSDRTGEPAGGRDADAGSGADAPASSPEGSVMATVTDTAECPNCGSMQGTDARYCDQCDTPLMPIRAL